MHYEVRIIHRASDILPGTKGRVRTLHGIYQSKQLALIVAEAQAKRLPLPGVVEVWECDEVKDTLIKGFPGQR
jgi:hypothetical protein